MADFKARWCAAIGQCPLRLDFVAKVGDAKSAAIAVMY